MMAEILQSLPRRYSNEVSGRYRLNSFAAVLFERRGVWRAALLLCVCLIPWSVAASSSSVTAAGDDSAESDSAESIDSGQVVASGPRVVAKEVDLDEPVDAAEPLQVQEETVILPDPVEPSVQQNGPQPSAVEASSGPASVLHSDTAQSGPEQLDGLQQDAVQPQAKSAQQQRSPAASKLAQSEQAALPPMKQKGDGKSVAVLPSELQSNPFVMLGVEVPPATATRLSWSPSHSFEGIAVPTPVLVVNGATRGHVLCLTAAVHGDELNGIEIVRRILYNLDADRLSGTVVGVPIVNLQGFRRGSRYLPDRRDLNRFFPGDPTGSSASRIAHSFFDEVIRHCDSLVDLHTGSFYRTNLPQLRADLRDADVLRLTHGFDATVVLHSEGALGTLRKAAVMAGIPAVTLEAGEPMRLQEIAVAHGVKSIQSLLSKLGMTKKSIFWGKPEPVYYQSVWVRSERGGILFSEVTLGEQVRRDSLLGTVTDPITNVRSEIRAPHTGRVLGMAVDQVVMPGFATYRLGLPADEDDVVPVNAPNRTETPFHTSQVDGDTVDPVEALPQSVQSGSLGALEDSE